MKLVTDVTVTATVPLMIDSRKTDESFLMTRCLFFTVGASELSSTWQLELGDEALSILLVEMTGVLHRPASGEPQFQNVEQVDELFNLIEDHADLVVDIETLWLPNSLFKDDESQSHGDIYRVDLDLFRYAFRFTHEELDERSFRELAADCAPPRRSEHETGVFRDWSRRVVVGAREEHLVKKKEGICLDDLYGSGEEGER